MVHGAKKQQIPGLCKGFSLKRMGKIPIDVENDKYIGFYFVLRAVCITFVGVMRYVALILLIMCRFVCADGQERSLFDSLCYRTELQTTLSGGDHTPLWLNANRYGLSSLKTTNGYVRAAVERPLTRDDGRRWGLAYGADMALATGFTSTLVVQQAYVEGRWLKGTLTVGAKAYPMELKNQALSTGSQTLGINARPVPQVRLALPDYWAIPGTRRWLALKGHVAFGKTTDDGWQKDFVAPLSKYTENTLYHSKAGYLKIGPRNLTLELGLEMGNQFGGSSYHEVLTDIWEKTDNEKGLSAFWHAFVPGGADSDEGIYGNTNGNHVGSWVMRLNIDQPSWNLGVYADHFFDDHSSMFMLDYDGYGRGEQWNERVSDRYVAYDLKDIMLGAEVQLKKVGWLNNVVVEYLYSKYQSGPVYHDRTPAYRDHIGGNDNYYNHYIFTGWQHWGQVMGNPLYRSPIYNNNGKIEVENNRFVAWHVGLSGEPSPSVHYRVLATYQTGLGTYDAPYAQPRYNLSVMTEVSWQLAPDWQVCGAWAMDKGRLLGENYGAQLRIIKTGIWTR